MSQLIKISGYSREPRASVVFVHGLGGHPYDTWRGHADAVVGDDSTFWPRWLAEDVEGLDVYTLGYEASPTNWLGKSMPFQDRAVNVFEHLLATPRLRRYPITLICHSLGGVVVKQLLIGLTLQKDRRPDAAALLQQIRQVVFCATPHTGSSKASLVRRLGFLAWPSPNTLALAANDPALRSINVTYRGLADDRRETLKHRVFYETQATPLGMIVDEGSSDPGLHSDPVPIDGDHWSIVKPSDRSSLLYAIVGDFVAEHPLRDASFGLREMAELPEIRTYRLGNLLPKLARLAILLCVVTVGYAGIRALLPAYPGPAETGQLNELTLAAILAAISDDEERIRVVEIRYGRALTPGERRVVVQIRGAIKNPLVLTEATQRALRSATTPEALSTVLSQVDTRPCGGAYIFTLEENWLRCQTGDKIPTLTTVSMGGPIVSREAIVFHFTGGDDSHADLKLFQSGVVNASAHLVVARSGAIVQLVPFDRQAWHAGLSNWAERGLTGLNKYTIGVTFTNSGELTKRTDGAYVSLTGRVVEPAQVLSASRNGVVRYWEKYTPEQLEAAAGIVKAFRAAQPGIALLGHDEISDGRKNDPGPAFPMARLRGL